MKKLSAIASVAALLASTLAFAQAKPTAAEAVASVDVIPRSALFGNPEKTQGRISPDGKYISFIAPRDGVLNVWLAERGKLDSARVLTNDTKRGIRQHFWAFDNKHVLFLQDVGGDENYHVYSVDVVSGEHERPLAVRGSAGRGVRLSWKKPGAVAIGMNDRDPRVSRRVRGEHRHRQAHARRKEHAGVRGLRPRSRPQAEARAEDRRRRRRDTSARPAASG